MTTEELIIKLQKCDPKARIFVRNVFFDKDLGKPRDCVDAAAIIVLSDDAIVISVDDSSCKTQYSKKERV